MIKVKSKKIPYFKIKKLNLNNKVKFTRKSRKKAIEFYKINHKKIINFNEIDFHSKLLITNYKLYYKNFEVKLLKDKTKKGSVRKNKIGMTQFEDLIGKDFKIIYNNNYKLLKEIKNNFIKRLKISFIKKEIIRFATERRKSSIEEFIRFRCSDEWIRGKKENNKHIENINIVNVSKISKKLKKGERFFIHSDNAKEYNKSVRKRLNIKV